MFIIVDQRFPERVFGPFGTQDEAITSIKGDYHIRAGWPKGHWWFDLKEEGVRTSVEVRYKWNGEVLDKLWIMPLREGGFRSQPAP